MKPRFIQMQLLSSAWTKLKLWKNVLETVGSGRWSEESLRLAVVLSVERVDELCTVRPKITPQRVSFFMHSS